MIDWFLMTLSRFFFTLSWNYNLQEDYMRREMEPMELVVGIIFMVSLMCIGGLLSIAYCRWELIKPQTLD